MKDIAVDLSNPDATFYSILPGSMADTGYLFEPHFRDGETTWSWAWYDKGQYYDLTEGFPTKSAAARDAAADWSTSGGEPESKIERTLKALATRLEKSGR